MSSLNLTPITPATLTLTGTATGSIAIGPVFTVTDGTTDVERPGTLEFSGATVSESPAGTALVTVDSGGSQAPTGPVSIAFDDTDIDTGIETALVVPADSVVDVLTFITAYWDPGDAGAYLTLSVGPVGGTYNVDTQDFVTYDLAGGNEGNASATLDPPIQAEAASVQAFANYMHHRFRTKTACAIFAKAGSTDPFTAGSADLYAVVTAL